MLNDSKIAAYTAILQEELLLATGCTEPIAVAYCAAKLREVLGGKPEKILAEISGNILKNVKSVVVPNTGGRRGHRRRHRRGHSGRRRRRKLQVIANVTEADVAAIRTYLDSTDIRVTCPETPCLLDIKLTGWREGYHACVRVANNHTNIIYMERDGDILRELPVTGNAEDNLQDKSVLNVRTSSHSQKQYLWTPYRSHRGDGRSRRTPPSPPRGCETAGAPTSAPPCWRAVRTGRHRRGHGRPPARTHG